MTTEKVEEPRAARAAMRNRRGINWEKWGWIYMRVTGVILVFLIFLHLFVNLVSGEGVNAIDFAFVAGKWADPFYVVADTMLLVFALTHGSNGMRTLVNDYAYNPTLRRILLGALAGSTIVLLALGLFVIYTFDPCPASAAADLLPTFCATVTQ